MRLQEAIAVKKARRDFWSFCCLLYPEFYKESRPYLKDLCQTLQAFYNGSIDKQILIINMPPRHGKTFTARLFVLWIFGQNPRTKIITGSYNQILSGLFAQQTRDGIMVENENVKQKYFSDIFPDTTIKQGDAAKGFWSLDGSEEKNYLATSPGGTSTGIGANFLIVDDIIKNNEEAANELVKDKHWEWYNNTLVQRMERPRKQILIMTRWASDDLVGRTLEKKAEKCHLITYKAVQDDGSMLCGEIMTKAEYEDVISEMGEDIASANYQQEPIDLKGRLYTSFKTYDRLPVDEQGNSLFEGIYSYTDTADEGADYLCTIIWGVYMREAYVLDVYYTQAGMEITEPETAKRFHEWKVNLARIESNNGGSGFARNVKRISEEELQNLETVIRWFHQSKNKKARIISNATWVMNHVLYPQNWKHKWPEYYAAMVRYQRDGENKHDDAPDCTTGVAETMYKLGA
ncbi:phage terminase large subunit [Blautia producta]|uniref:phage terminase large subunit n=1 Tax=Blautia producta TaxID=33035 RepID=UPI001D03192C|nr:phage terminase large subunit [Blautia producta]MCB5874222.1 phage terminase large subunit [Blautia producta]